MRVKLDVKYNHIMQGVAGENTAKTRETAVKGGQENCKVNEKQRNQRTAKAGCIIQPASHKTPYSEQPISTGGKRN